jgi:hypothetical protein
VWPAGPPDSFKVPPEEIVREVLAAGFVQIKAEECAAVTDASPHHFTLIFAAAAAATQ